jgi:uncharacterized protein
MANQAPAACPLCRKPADPAHAPFCSRGCKDRDLLNWLGDAYRVPGPTAPGEKPLDSDD